jgi:hypothetical protein
VIPAYPTGLAVVTRWTPPRACSSARGARSAAVAERTWSDEAEPELPVIENDWEAVRGLGGEVLAIATGTSFIATRRLLSERGGSPSTRHLRGHPGILRRSAPQDDASELRSDASLRRTLSRRSSRGSRSAPSRSFLPNGGMSSLPFVPIDQVGVGFVCQSTSVKLRALSCFPSACRPCRPRRGTWRSTGRTRPRMLVRRVNRHAVRTERREDASSPRTEPSSSLPRFLEILDDALGVHCSP